MESDNRKNIFDYYEFKFYIFTKLCTIKKLL